MEILQSYKIIWDSLVLFSKEIRVKKDECQFKKNNTIYYTHDVMKVPKPIKLFHDLEQGDINSVTGNIEELDTQLEWFKSTDEPFDSVKLDTLRAMYCGKQINRSRYGLATNEIIYHTIKTAKENQKVSQSTKKR